MQKLDFLGLLYYNVHMFLQERIAMTEKVKSNEKMVPVKKIRVLRQSKGWRILLEEGINNQGLPYKKRLDYYKGELRQKLHLENGELKKTVFLTKHHGDIAYERTMKMTPNGRQTIEQGWTGRHGYFSLKMPNGRDFAHFGNFLVEEWDNSVGRVREIKIDKNGEYHMEKRTIRKKGQAPELLDESKTRNQARRIMAVVSACSNLSNKEKWEKIRKVIMRYRQKVM